MNEIHQYALKNNIEFYYPDVSKGTFLLFIPNISKETISCAKGNSNEYNILNGKGGFYYNNKTGEVRINLTQPLSDYFLIYIGGKGEEIPADW